MAGVYSVSQVNTYIKNMFAQDYALNRLSVQGEVSNCKYHTSGHIYFTLKDQSGTLSAVMFASQRKGLAFRMQEGQRVIIKGSVDVYERDGKYQLYAREITLDGTGDLFARFQKLRDELEEMGMFSPDYKRPIPRYARTVGIVTASTGAAIRDIINIASRRNPYVQLILCPALVQGEGAAASIARGIRTLDAMNPDVLIIGRGGGSIEDLWAFNEEVVARAIFDCETPIISAVGHETDVTIADYVADLRAPTPSAAAELAVFDYRQFEQQMASCELTLERGLERRLERVRARLKQYELRVQLYSPERQINERRQRLADLEEQMQRLLSSRLTASRHRLELLASRLHGLSPLQKISKGYGFITDHDNHRIESIRNVKPGDSVTIRLSDGHFRAEVTECKKNDRSPGVCPVES